MSDPFATEECHLVNIITKAVMPGYIKEGVLTQGKIGQALFDTFARERIVEARLSVWSPLKKANLNSWKSSWPRKKNKTTCGVAPLKDDRALFARFLVVILSGPDLDIRETISTFELAEYPRALLFSDGSLRHCATKNKVMNILERILPAQQQPQTSTVQPHSADPSSRQVVIIDAMAVAQAMGKLPWVRNGRDLASHFIEVIDSKSEGATEVHVVFDCYDIPNSLKEGTRQKRRGTSRAVVYKITVNAVIDKITMKDLLSCSQNKETLAIFLAAQLIECKKD